MIRILRWAAALPTNTCHFWVNKSAGYLNMDRSSSYHIGLCGGIHIMPAPTFNFSCKNDANHFFWGLVVVVFHQSFKCYFGPTYLAAMYMYNSEFPTINRTERPWNNKERENCFEVSLFHVILVDDVTMMFTANCPPWICKNNVLYGLGCLVPEKRPPCCCSFEAL